MDNRDFDLSTREQFITLWGHKLDPEQKKVCSPECTFLLVSGGGFALKFKRKVCLVVMAVGNGLTMFRELARRLRQHGYRTLLFYFKENSPASAFVRYAKARRWVSRDRYDNGEPAHLALVRLNGKRFGKWETPEIPQ